MSTVEMAGNYVRRMVETEARGWGDHEEAQSSAGVADRNRGASRRSKRCDPPLTRQPGPKPRCRSMRSWTTSSSP